MGKIYESISPELGAWIREQKIFFVATAPLSADGSVNCSPKGGDSFRVLDGNTVAYLDLTGSGVETIAHVQENGRIVVMFCAFSGSPKIVRLHGKGKVVYPQDTEFADLGVHFQPHPGARAIVTATITRISDSCGFAVPLYEFAGDRDVLDKWSKNKGPEGLDIYRKTKNATSIDGIPGYRTAGDSTT